MCTEISQSDSSIATLDHTASGKAQSPIVEEVDRPATTDGDVNADEMFGVVYTQLKRMAHQRISHGEESINTTGLVHELYLRVCVGRELTFVDRGQFFGYAARAMRNILIDRARKRITLRLGAEMQRSSLTDAGQGCAEMSPQSALQLDSALTALEAADPRAARVVELHYFIGLPLRNVAEILGVVRRTVDRDWRYARSFLLAHIG